MDIISYITAEHVWAISLAIIVSWAVTEPIKRFVRYITNTNDNIFPILVSYVVAAFVIYLRWPGDMVEDILMAVVFGTSAPIFHKLFLTMIGKKWPWVRTTLTGERKTYEPDDLTGLDTTVWLSPDEVTKRLEKDKTDTKTKK